MERAEKDPHFSAALASEESRRFTSGSSSIWNRWQYRRRPARNRPHLAEQIDGDQGSMSVIAIHRQSIGLH
jgi:hypothetical protein